MKTLQEIRLDRELSLKEVASKAGLSVYKVKQIENKEYKTVKVIDLILLLKFYGIKPSEIDYKPSEVNLGSI